MEDGRGERDASATLARDAQRTSHARPRSTGADRTGSKLLHFHIAARLGEGGMGVVYKAIDEKLRRPVALKVLAERYLADDRNRELIFREARSAAAVHHPNIATIYEVHDAPDAAFLAMELVDGETLRDRIRAGALPVGEALAIAKPIADALAHAHKQGVVHRDLKPENVMRTREGRVKILDFGLAKAASETEPSIGRSVPPEPTTSPAALAPTIPISSSDTHAGRVMGTPAYMAPEQARGEVVDARADVFAFGALLYEMLTGKAPFVRSSAMPWDWGGEGTPDWTAAPLPRSLPSSLRELVSKCMAFDRARRFANGDELLAAIEALENRRTPTRAIALGLVAVLATGGLWLATRSRIKAPTQPLAASAPSAFVPPPRTEYVERIAMKTNSSDSCVPCLDGSSIVCAASTPKLARFDAATGAKLGEVDIPALQRRTTHNVIPVDGNRLVYSVRDQQSASTWLVDEHGDARLLFDGTTVISANADATRFLLHNETGYVVRTPGADSTPQLHNAGVI